jgi:uncharacterized protein YjbI with pentapeptide repeats
MSEAEQEKPADAWGQPISEERQRELQDFLDRWVVEPDHGARKGPFESVRLTGADVCWLAQQAGPDTLGNVPNLHLEGADLRRAHLARAVLRKARLEGIQLGLAWLEGADLSAAHLEGADLRGARLGGASLEDIHLEGAFVSRAYLTGAHLRHARLAGAHLSGTDLSEANLSGAHLEACDLFAAGLDRAGLDEAHLEGANLGRASLASASLEGAWLDSKTVLTEAKIDDGTRLADIQWGGVGAVNLTRLPWDRVRRLGDERNVSLWLSARAQERVARAYRQLAAQLRVQGMSEVADRFLYRAQVRQRRVLLRRILDDVRRPWLLPRGIARYVFSWFLAVLAGYGYAPARTLFWYLVTIVGFTVAYLKTTTGWIPFGLPHPSGFAPLTWYEALILSVSSFHGRGFFQPVQSLGDPVAALAALEAVVGLLIEISFIATFTQRFVNSR